MCWIRTSIPSCAWSASLVEFVISPNVIVDAIESAFVDELVDEVRAPVASRRSEGTWDRARLWVELTAATIRDVGTRTEASADVRAETDRTLFLVVETTGVVDEDVAVVFAMDAVDPVVPDVDDVVATTAPVATVDETHSVDEGEDDAGVTVDSEIVSAVALEESVDAFDADRSPGPVRVVDAVAFAGADDASSVFERTRSCVDATPGVMVAEVVVPADVDVPDVVAVIELPDPLADPAVANVRVSILASVGVVDETVAVVESDVDVETSDARVTDFVDVDDAFDVVVVAGVARTLDELVGSRRAVVVVEVSTTAVDDVVAAPVTLPSEIAFAMDDDVTEDALDEPTEAVLLVLDVGVDVTGDVAPVAVRASIAV